MFNKYLLFLILGLVLAGTTTAQVEPQAETEADPQVDLQAESQAETQTEQPDTSLSNVDGEAGTPTGLNEIVEIGAPRVHGGSEHHLVVTITGADPATGTVEISLFKNNEFFMSDPYLQNSGPIREDGTFLALFNKLDQGEYAVVVVHDANDNQKLDTGFLGFGGESYAYSTNYKPWFGRPDFEDIAITVDGSTQLEISLQ